MSISKSLLSIVATALIGSITVIVATPKKVLKPKARQAKTSTQNGIDEKENLFI